MTNQEAFKVGFLMKCAEDGLTQEQTDDRIRLGAAMVKLSTWTDFFTKPIGWTGKAIGFGANQLKWPLLLAPPMAGITGGYMLANAGNDTYDIEEAKQREELAEYYRAIDQLRQSRQNRELAN